MASSSTFSTHVAAEPDKTVNAYPLRVLRCNAHVVTGYPQPQVGPPPAPPSPQPVYLHQLFRNHRRNQQQRLEEEAFLYRTITAILFFLVFMGFLIFTIWLFLRPRFPQVRIVSAALSPLSTTDTNVTVACNVSLLLTNPNHKLTVFYDTFELLLYYRTHKVPLFEVQLPPFAQPRTNDTVLLTHMEISNANVGKDVVKALRDDFARGEMSFGVNVFASVRIESKDWKTRGRFMKIFCDDVILGFSSENGRGALLNPYQECQVVL